jgi:hypothetical protein
MGAGGAGPQGMVMGAVSNMNAALGAGGIGALAMMPLQQKQIMDQAARTLSPYEQTAMRFSMASDTGKFLGLKGAGGFAAGARMLYGDEVASQMMTEAANPAYWRSQKAMIQRERDDLARSQRQDIMDAAPGMFSRLGTAANRAIGRPISRAFDPLGGAGEAVGRGWRDLVTRPLQEIADRAAGKITYDRLDPEMSADTSSKEGRAAYAARRKRVGQTQRKSRGGIDITGRDAYDLFTTDLYGGDQHIADYTGTALDVAKFGLTGLLGIPATIGLAWAEAYGLDTSEIMRGGIGAAYKAVMLSGDSQRARDARGRATAMQKEQAWSVARIEGSAGRTLSSGFKSGEYTALEKALGLKAGQGAWAVHAAGKEMAAAAADASGVIVDDRMTSVTFKNAMMRGLAGSSGKGQDAISAALTGDLLESTYESAYASGRAGGGATARSMFQKFEETAKGGVARSSQVATRARMEEIRTRKDELADKLGLGYFSGRDELDKLAAKYSPAQTLIIAYNTAKGLDKSQQDAWMSKIKTAMAEEAGITDPNDPRMEGINEKAINEVDRLKGIDISDKLRGNLNAITQKRDGANLLLERIDLITEEQMSERTSGVMSKLSIAAGMGGTGIKDETDLMRLSKSERDNLRKKGFGKIAGILDKSEGASAAQRKDILEQIRVETDTMGSELSSESLSTPTGEKAQELKRSEKSMENLASQMEEAFKGFNVDTTKAFRDGAIALNDAMIALQAKSGTPFK